MGRVVDDHARRILVEAQDKPVFVGGQADGVVLERLDCRLARAKQFLQHIRVGAVSKKRDTENEIKTNPINIAGQFF